MLQFFQTRMGQTYYEHHIPQIINRLEKIEKEMVQANELKQEELVLKKTELSLKERELALREQELKQFENQTETNG